MEKTTACHVFERKSQVMWLFIALVVARSGGISNYGPNHLDHVAAISKAFFK
jgi:hypothetical protein